METKNEILNTVTEFIDGADESNLERLDKVLHPAFRNVQQGFFDQAGVFINDKEKYLTLIAEKKFGGMPRKMQVLSVDILPDMAMVAVKLESPQLIFHSFISLVFEDRAWKVIGNFPHVEVAISA